MASTFDPITLEILWRRLISIVDEADGTVARTAFSSLLRDAHDYTCMFTDRKGRELAQGALRPRASPGPWRWESRTSSPDLPSKPTGRETSSSRTTRGPWQAI